MALLRKLTGEQKRNVAHWAMELVIVIAGVLIALWVQQWAERRRAHADMVAAEEAIHAEVREFLKDLIWRQVISQCHVERASQLKAMLLTGGPHWPGITGNALLQNEISEATGIATVVPGVWPRPFDPFSTAAWTSALATGALAPMDRQRFAKLAELYGDIGFYKENQEREYRAAATLSALTLPQELTAETRTRMFQALYEVDTARFIFVYGGAGQLAQRMKGLGWNDKAAIDRFIAEDRATDIREGKKWRPCIQPYRNPFADQGA